MNIRISFTRLLAPVLAVCLLPFAAQGLEFRVLSWSGTLSDLHLATGSGSRTIPLRAGEDVLSPVYRMQGERALTLFGSSTKGGPVGTQPMATLPLPAGLERAILVLAPNPGEGDAYVGLWLDDSPESRPENTITLHNLASMPVALRIGSEQVQLQPRESHGQGFTASERAVMIQAAIRRGERWERVISDPQPVKQGFRILVILRDGRRLADGSREALDRVTFYDYSRPPKAP